MVLNLLNFDELYEAIVEIPFFCQGFSALCRTVVPWVWVEPSVFICCQSFTFGCKAWCNGSELGLITASKYVLVICLKMKILCSSNETVFTFLFVCFVFIIAVHKNIIKEMIGLINLPLSSLSPVVTTWYDCPSSTVHRATREFLVYSLVVGQGTCINPCCHLLHPFPFLSGKQTVMLVNPCFCLLLIPVHVS